MILYFNNILTGKQRKENSEAIVLLGENNERLVIPKQIINYSIDKEEEKSMWTKDQKNYLDKMENRIMVYVDNKITESEERLRAEMKQVFNEIKNLIIELHKGDGRA